MKGRGDPGSVLLIGQRAVPRRVRWHRGIVTRSSTRFQAAAASSLSCSYGTDAGASRARLRQACSTERNDTAMRTSNRRRAAIQPATRPRPSSSSIERSPGLPGSSEITAPAK
ncbi:hypothetical protein [Microbacterium sp. Se5.02b]|uniref:hypothetical protein n=1 Tax=Microbacterium sp. Se5.02b TaxID=2864103 RepID=UPI00215D835C|nr:hypothetical protein [Microbacterium sp. Se5.02b]